MCDFTTKRCRVCGEFKLSINENFGIYRAMGDGLNPRCKQCINKNKKEKLQKTRQTIPAKPIGRPKREYTPDELLAIKDRQRKNSRDWQLSNPGKNRAKSLRYLARKRGAEGRHTADDVTIILKSQKGLCWWCGVDVGDKYHVDHRIALSKGGSDNPANLCVSCARCNRIKSDKSPWEFNGRLL